MRIFHIIDAAAWQKAKVEEVYHPSSLDQEGFIHASTEEQVLPTANRRYLGRKDLFLLFIDSNKITSPIKFEYSKGAQEEHPHIYGELNLDAVDYALEFIPDMDGSFAKIPDNQ